MAPAAVRNVELSRPLELFPLPPSRSGQPYRSLLALVRLAGDPLGTVVMPLGTSAEPSCDRLERAVRLEFADKVPETIFGDYRRPIDPPDGSLRRGHAPGGRSSRRRSVSVVVATCAEPAKLRLCLRSILDCAYENFEVIVVENRPGSGVTSHMLTAEFSGESRLRYVEQPRSGTSAARNAGLASAEGEIVAFVDDDVVVDEQWLERCASAFDASEDVVCVAGLILPKELESESQVLLEQFAQFGKGFSKEVFRLPASRDLYPMLPYTPGLIGSGANMALRTEVMRQLGGFDLALGGGTPALGGEDLDVFVRILLEGRAIVYEPRAIAWHSHPEGMPRLERQAHSYGVGMGALLAKQLLAGRRRLDLLRAVPRGISYLRDPESRKNRAKSPNYPHRLDRLERRGLAIGPIRYCLSVLNTLRGRRSPAWGSADGDRPIGLLGPRALEGPSAQEAGA